VLIGKRKSRFHFHFSFSSAALKMEFQLLFSLFVYPQQNSNFHVLFCLPFLWDTENQNLNLGQSSSFFVFVFLSLSYFTWTGRMSAFPVANNRPGNHILDDVFVRPFLIEENNSYEDLLGVIKKVFQLSWYQEERVSCVSNSRYPVENEDCRLRARVKRMVYFLLFAFTRMKP